MDIEWLYAEREPMNIVSEPHTSLAERITVSQRALRCRHAAEDHGALLTSCLVAFDLFRRLELSELSSLLRRLIVLLHKHRKGRWLEIAR